MRSTNILSVAIITLGVLGWGRPAGGAAINLTGTVADLNGKPLYGVGVHLAATDTATGTDSLGAWRLAAGTTSIQRGEAMSILDGVSSSRRIVVEGGRLRVRYTGVDASGRAISTLTPPVLVPGTGFRALAGDPVDTILFSWNGRIRARVALASFTAGGTGVQKIDTATLGTDIPWNTWGYSYGRFTDPRDGQVYRTTKLGTQIWMAENLNFKVDSSARALRSADSSAKYGRLYQWSAAMKLPAALNLSLASGSDIKQRGACPVGWHVPSDTEWATLQRFADTTGAGAVTKLRSNGGWLGADRLPGNSGDTVGFRGLPGGFLCCGNFLRADSLRSSGSDGFWWSASEKGAALAGRFSKTGRGSGTKANGYSLRCVSDSAVADPYADLKLLPRDTGGVNRAIPKGTKTKVVGNSPDSATYGYYLYLPSGARDTNTTARFPLLVSLHGSGSSENAGLDAVGAQGPANLILFDRWHPRYPFIVASPQNHADNGWNSTELQAYIAYMVAHYPVDPKRIYLTGISMGGIGLYNYLLSLGSNISLAAAVPVMGSASATNAKNVSCPVWAFHGAKDVNVSPTNDQALVKAILAAHPNMDVRITMFSNLQHEWNGWWYPYYPNYFAEEPVHDGRTDIDPTYAPFYQNIYDWMLQYKRP